MLDIRRDVERLVVGPRVGGVVPLVQKVQRSCFAELNTKENRFLHHSRAQPNYQGLETRRKNALCVR
eukprot:7362253-Prorocentrum_lima.AAC.1